MVLAAVDPDGEVRYMIAPYKLYKDVSELDSVDRCAARKHASAKSYYGCFILDHSAQDFTARPMIKRPGD